MNSSTRKSSTQEAMHHNSTATMTQAFQKGEEKKQEKTKPNDELFSLFQAAHRLVEPFLIQLTKEEHAASHFLNNSLPLSHEKAKIKLLNLLTDIPTSHQIDKITSTEINKILQEIDNHYPAYSKKTFEIIQILFSPIKTFFAKIEYKNSLVSLFDSEEIAIFLAKKILGKKYTDMQINQDKLARELIYQLSILFQKAYFDTQNKQYKTAFIEKIHDFLKNCYSDDTEIQIKIKLTEFLDSTNDTADLFIKNLKLELLKLYQDYYLIYFLAYRHTNHKKMINQISDWCEKIISIDITKQSSETDLNHYLQLYLIQSCLLIEKIHIDKNGKIELIHAASEQKRQAELRHYRLQLNTLYHEIENNNNLDIESTMKNIDSIENSIQVSLSLDLKKSL